MAKEEKDTLEKKAGKDKDSKDTKKDKKGGKNEKNNKNGKNDKNAGEKKSSGIARWFRDLKIEFRNVTWPKKQTVLANSGIVIGTIVISSIFVGLLDAGLLELIKFLLGLAQNQ